MLLLPEPARFSVDIDIIVHPEIEKTALEAFLNKVKEDNVFNEFVLDKKRSYNGRIPKAHYKFIYNSLHSGKPQEILLDILFESNHYPNCIERQITCEWIRLTSDALFVTMPDIDCIAGDKLTAFAPATIGVPYNAEKEREIIKQLFDISILFDLITQVEAFKNSFKRIATVEIAYRGIKTLSIDKVLDDIIQTALILARRENQVNTDSKAKFTELMRGIKQFNSFVYKGNFRIDDALTASAKAAYLATIIKTDYKGELARYDPAISIASCLIADPDYSFLNKKLRNIPGGALFYWSEAIKLL